MSEEKLKNMKRAVQVVLPAFLAALLGVGFLVFYTYAAPQGYERSTALAVFFVQSLRDLPSTEIDTLALCEKRDGPHMTILFNDGLLLDYDLKTLGLWSKNTSQERWEDRYFDLDCLGKLRLLTTPALTPNDGSYVYRFSYSIFGLQAFVNEDTFKQQAFSEQEKNLVAASVPAIAQALRERNAFYATKEKRESSWRR